MGRKGVYVRKYMIWHTGIEYMEFWKQKNGQEIFYQIYNILAHLLKCPSMVFIIILFVWQSKLFTYNNSDII
jgi:hypothetical protein